MIGLMVLTAKVDSSMHPLNELNGFLYHSVPLPPLHSPISSPKGGLKHRQYSHMTGMDQKKAQAEGQ